MAKERVSPPTYSFVYGRQLWEGGDFHIHNKFIVSYQTMPSVRLWFVIWKASSFAISAFNRVHRRMKLIAARQLTRLPAGQYRSMTQKWSFVMRTNSTLQTREMTRCCYFIFGALAGQIAYRTKMLEDKLVWQSSSAIFDKIWQYLVDGIVCAWVCLLLDEEESNWHFYNSRG